MLPIAFTRDIYRTYATVYSRYFVRVYSFDTLFIEKYCEWKLRSDASTKRARKPLVRETALLFYTTSKCGLSEEELFRRVQFEYSSSTVIPGMLTAVTHLSGVSRRPPGAGLQIFNNLLRSITHAILINLVIRGRVVLKQVCQTAGSRHQMHCTYD